MSANEHSQPYDDPAQAQSENEAIAVFESFETTIIKSGMSDDTTEWITTENMQPLDLKACR